MTMKVNQNTMKFLRSLARSTTGAELIRYLEDQEKYYSDIRNLKDGGTSDGRIEGLKIFREALLDKLISMRSDSTTPSDGEEYT